MNDFDSGLVVDDGGIDWQYLYDSIPEMANLFENDFPILTDRSSNSPSTDALSSWIAEVENTLMRDVDDDDAGEGEGGQLDSEYCNEFLSDVLVDLPPENCDGEVVVCDEKSLDSCGSEGSGDKVAVVFDEAEKTVDDRHDDDADDPVSKKRKRQLRNRDAAVRSRERKKMHVKDLELKSRYLEGECRRLGQLLHYCYAENQALRMQLQTGSEASGAFMNKQESAVLLLESLLLGSLLWFMGIVCLFHLPNLLQFPQEKMIINRKWENVAPKGSRSKTFKSLLAQMCFKGRRCKASRARIKPSFLILLVRF